MKYLALLVIILALASPTEAKPRQQRAIQLETMTLTWKTPAGLGGVIIKEDMDPGVGCENLLTFTQQNIRQTWPDAEFPVLKCTPICLRANQGRCFSFDQFGDPVKVRRYRPD